MRARRWLIGAAAAAGLHASAWASPGQDYMLYCMGCHGAEAQGVAKADRAQAEVGAEGPQSASGAPGMLPNLLGTIARCPHAKREARLQQPSCRRQQQRRQRVAEVERQVLADQQRESYR